MTGVRERRGDDGDAPARRGPLRQGRLRRVLSAILALTLTLALTLSIPLLGAPHPADATSPPAANSAVPFGATGIGANAVATANAPIVGLAATHDGLGLLAHRERRRHLRLRRRPLLRLRRRTPPERAHRGHGGHARWRRLLARGVRRRHLQLRRRAVLRVDGLAPPQCADRRHGRHPRRWRLLARGVRRWHLQLRRRRLRRLSRQPPPQCARRRHGGVPRRRRLLAGRP